MKKSPSIRKKLLEIFETEAFDRLRFYKKEDKWDKLSTDERELLGTLFVMQGERHLLSGEEKKVKDTFSLASRIAPGNPKVLYRQGLAFSAADQNTNLLHQACIALKGATELNPGFFDAWHSWGEVLLKLGLFFQDQAYFEEALEKFLQAEALIEAAPRQKMADFYHKFGRLWYQLAKTSGEACDFSESIKRLNKALGFGVQSERLYCDLGNALTDFAYLVNKVDLLFEGLEYYWKAVPLAQNSSEPFCSLAFHFEKVFRATSQESFFQMATECFTGALQIQEQNATFWLRWGYLLLSYGKSRKMIEPLEEALLKFEEANKIEPNHPKILSGWAEVKMLIGGADESINELKEAERMVILALEMEPEAIEIWGLYGALLIEFGKYFDCPKYFHKAIEKFQFALSHQRDNYMLWSGLSSCYYFLGEIENDYHHMERASRLALRVIETGGRPFPQYWNDWGLTLYRLLQMTQEKKYLVAAIEKFEQAIKLSNNSFGADAEWLYNLGVSLDALGDIEDGQESYAKAIMVLNKLVDAAPTWPGALFALATAESHLAEEGKSVDLFKKAQAHFAEAYEIDPESDAILNEWGVTLIAWSELIDDPAKVAESKELKRDAETILRQAASMGNGNALYNLAALYSLEGEVDRAIDCLERAMKLQMLPPLEEMLNDPWLEKIWANEGFKRLVEGL